MARRHVRDYRRAVTLLADVAEAPVFATATRTWTWSDVFLAALLWGEWDALLQATRDAQASKDAVEQAGRDWRVARRLIAGDELKAWLARRDLSVADWKAHLRRAIGERSADAEPDPAVLWAEGSCSGAWADVARRLAARAAAADVAGTSPAPGTPPPAWFARMPDAARAREIGIDPGAVAVRAGELWSAERALRDLASSAAAPDEVASVVASHNVDWLRVDCDWLEAGDEDVAREAALLARVDGLELAEVARRAGLPLEPRRVYVGELDAELQPRVISAAPGDLLGPVALNGGATRWLVAAVRDKVTPTVDDPEIRERAERTAVTAAVERAVAERVRWHEHD